MQKTNEEQMNQQEFTASMAKLRAHYQNTVADEGLWAASVLTYWDAFRSFSRGAILSAFSAAWKKHRDWMPSAGQLLELVQVAEKAQGLTKPLPVDRQLEEPKWDPDAKRKLKEIIDAIGDDKAIA